MKQFARIFLLESLKEKKKGNKEKIIWFAKWSRKSKSFSQKFFSELNKFDMPSNVHDIYKVLYKYLLFLSLLLHRFQFRKWEWVTCSYVLNDHKCSKVVFSCPCQNLKTKKVTFKTLENIFNTPLCPYCKIVFTHPIFPK